MCFLHISAVYATENAIESYEQGKRAQVSGEIYRAIEYYKVAVEQNPAYLEALAGLASAYFTLGEYAVALEYVQKALQLGRGRASLWNMTGRILLGLGRPDDAEKAYRDALKLEPNNIDANFGLAEIDIARGRMKNAVNKYEQALQMSPDNRRALLSLVMLYGEVGDYEAAGEYIDRALYYHSEKPQVRYLAAQYYLEVGDLASAEDHASMAVRQDPESVEAILLLSQIYIAKGNHAPAAELVARVLATHSDDHLLWYALGSAYGATGRSEDALDAFEAAVSIRDDDEISRLALEYTAIDGFSSESPRRTAYAQYRFDRGKEFLEKNYLGRARQELRRGLLISPHATGGRILYSELLDRLGFPQKALSMLQIAADEIRDTSKNPKQRIDEATAVVGIEPESLETWVSDRIEIAESMLQDGVSFAWDIDQYTIERHRFSLLVCYSIHPGDMIHVGAEGIVSRLYREALLGYEQIVVDKPIRVDSYAEAFRLARETDVDYFVIFRCVEDPRSVTLLSSVYSAQSGALLDRFSAYRTGNERVATAIGTITGSLAERLPTIGILLDRKFDSAIVSLGRIDELEPESEYAVVRPEGVSLHSGEIAVVMDPDDRVGTFTPDTMDEMVSRGTLEKNGFFDMMNQGDYVVEIPEEEPESGQEETFGYMYRRFLDIQ